MGRMMEMSLAEMLGCSRKVAAELLLWAGDNIDLVITCSEQSSSLKECKARILNARIEKLERMIGHE